MRTYRADLNRALLLNAPDLIQSVDQLICTRSQCQWASVAQGRFYAAGVTSLPWVSPLRFAGRAEQQLPDYSPAPGSQEMMACSAVISTGGVVATGTPPAAASSLSASITRCVGIRGSAECWLSKRGLAYVGLTQSETDKILRRSSMASAAGRQSAAAALVQQYRGEPYQRPCRAWPIFGKFRGIVSNASGRRRNRDSNSG